MAAQISETVPSQLPRGRARARARTPGGTSGLILDCAIAKANPADSTWAVPMLKRQISLYGHAPRQASLDGGFASKDNLTHAAAVS